MRTNTVLWILQGLLAALFLFAGAMKLILPAAALQGPIALQALFLRFIGVAEILGAIGLVAPWLTGVRPMLTPLAAAGLVVIMVGATVLTAGAMGVAPALFPLLVGAAASAVAYGRQATPVAGSQLPFQSGPQSA